MSNTVYIVVDGTFSDGHAIAVYTTSQKAKRRARDQERRHKKFGHSYTQVWVENFEVRE